MDPVIGEVIASRIYSTCFKQVYDKEMKSHSDQDQGKFDQCLNSYVESYKSVSQSFIKQISKLPKKGLSLDGS